MWGPSTVRDSANQPPQNPFLHHSTGHHYATRTFQPTPTYVMVQPQITHTPITHSPYMIQHQWWGDQSGPSTSFHQYPLLSPPDPCVYHPSPIFRKRK